MLPSLFVLALAYTAQLPDYSSPHLLQRRNTFADAKDLVDLKSASSSRTLGGVPHSGDLGNDLPPGFVFKSNSFGETSSRHSSISDHEESSWAHPHPHPHEHLEPHATPPASPENILPLHPTKSLSVSQKVNTKFRNAADWFGFYLRRFFGKKPNDIPRPFSEAKLLRKTYGTMLMHEASEEKEQAIVNELAKKIYADGKIDPKFISEETADRLRKVKSVEEAVGNDVASHLSQARALLEATKEDEKLAKETVEQLNTRLYTTIKSTKDDAVQRVAKQMASWKGTRQGKEQRRLETALSQRKYLAQFLGLFGPRDILAPKLDDHVAIAKLAKDLEISPDQVKVLVQESQALKKPFDDIFKYLDVEAKLKANKKSMPEPLYVEVHKTEESHKRIMEAFGGSTDKVEEVIKKMKNLSEFRAFRKDAEQPKNDFGTLMQYLEPFGRETQGTHLTSKNTPLNKIGLSDAPEDYDALRATANHLEPIVKGHYDTALRLRQFRQQLETYYSPEGIQAFKKAIAHEYPKVKQPKTSSSRN